MVQDGVQETKRYRYHEHIATKRTARDRRRLQTCSASGSSSSRPNSLNFSERSQESHGDYPHWNKSLVLYHHLLHPRLHQTQQDSAAT